MKNVWLKTALAAMMMVPFMAGAADTTPAQLVNDAKSVKQATVAEARAGVAATRENLNRLRADHKSLAAKRVALETSIDALRAEMKMLREKEAHLMDVDKAQEADRRALEGTLRLTAGAVANRLQKAAYTADAAMPNAELQALRRGTEYPKIADVELLTQALLTEIELSGQTTREMTQVTLPSGDKVQAPVIRFGSLTAVAELPDGYHYAIPNASANALMVAPGGRESQGALKDLFAGKADQVAMDLSGGDVFMHVPEDKTLYKHLQAGGNIVWVILGLGALALLAGLWRLIALTRIGQVNEGLMRDYFKAVSEGRFDEAANLMTGPNPIYRVLGHMARYGGSTVIGWEKSYEEADSLYVAPLQKFITFVALAAAVAPLLGLLGTVTGMISTFDIITLFGNSDPKLLSGGISIALVTTEVGLVVAVVLMVVHFLLSRRYGTITDQVEENVSIALARLCRTVPGPGACCEVCPDADK